MSTVTAVPLQPVRRRVLIYLWAGIALAALAAVALALQAPRDAAEVALAKVQHGDASVRATPSGLLYKVLAPGAGTAHPTDADVALITYDGKLVDGTPFDASQQPTPMPVKGVVPGFSEAMKLMPRGAKYRVWIKPALGYGDKEQRNPSTGQVVIPARSVLVFDIAMLDWKSEAEIRQAQMIQQMMQQRGQAGAGAPPPPAGAAPAQ